MMALVIGASSGIAQAIIAEYLSQSDEHTVVAVSRSDQVEGSLTSEYLSRTRWYTTDYSELSIQHIVKKCMSEGCNPDYVFLCNGFLHSDTVQPEKRVMHITAESMESVWRVNSVIPMLWLKHLHPLLKKSASCCVTVFSARIGSITDNKLGGWFSYRMSKAALNMGVKTAAVEYARSAKNVTFLLYHPGTTDTPLSAPFQANVPTEKLFSPQFTAERLWQVIGSLPEGDNIFFRDWQGKPVPW